MRAASGSHERASPHQSKVLFIHGTEAASGCDESTESDDRKGKVESDELAVGQATKRAGQTSTKCDITAAEAIWLLSIQLILQSNSKQEQEIRQRSYKNFFRRCGPLGRGCGLC